MPVKIRFIKYYGYRAKKDANLSSSGQNKSQKIKPVVKGKSWQGVIILVRGGVRNLFGKMLRAEGLTGYLTAVSHSRHNQLMI